MADPLVLMRPFVPPRALPALAEVLATRWLGQGPRVDEFEAAFSARFAAGRPCVAVNSCTAALHLAYLLAGIEPGDEVITPVFTCTATNIPLLYLGAKIRFADVDPLTLNASVESVAQLRSPRTKAVIGVSYGGNPVLSAIDILDAAQALGGWHHTGAMASAPDPKPRFVCYSFQAVKHITTGDGGMLVCPDEATAEKARRIRWFGIDRKAKQAGTWANDIWEIGFKYQMTDLAAALGLAALPHVAEQIAHRQRLMAAYREGLDGIPGIRLVKHHIGSVAWLCTVLVEGGHAPLKKALAAAAIESDQVHYRNDRYTVFAQFCVPGSCPQMDAIEHDYLCLPLQPAITLSDVDRVCSAVREHQRKEHG